MDEFLPGLVAALPLSALVGLAGWVTGNRWEMRKLSRAERATAYAAFLSAANKRWGAFSERDRIVKSKGRDSDEVSAMSQAVGNLRDEMYEAYCSVQILGSTEAVKTALDVIALYDRRNRSFFDSRTKSPGSDERADVLAEFVEAARADLRLKSFGDRLSR